MSSVDSSLLSGASYLAHNLYGNALVAGCCPDGVGTATSRAEKKNSIVVRVFGRSLSAATIDYAHMQCRFSVVVLGVVSAVLSLSTSTIYGLWVLAGDLGYAIVFPQFVAAVRFEKCVNTAGSVAAAVVGIVLRYRAYHEKSAHNLTSSLQSSDRRASDRPSASHFYAKD